MASRVFHELRPQCCRCGADRSAGDLVKVDCAACHHVALLTPAALLQLGLCPATKVLRSGDAGQGGRCRAMIDHRAGDDP
jgi:hypothetical protein